MSNFKCYMLFSRTVYVWAWLFFCLHTSSVWAPVFINLNVLHICRVATPLCFCMVELVEEVDVRTQRRTTGSADLISAQWSQWKAQLSWGDCKCAPETLTQVADIITYTSFWPSSLLTARCIEEEEEDRGEGEKRGKNSDNKSHIGEKGGLMYRKGDWAN